MLRHELVGEWGPEDIHSWDERDALLYALSVGAGAVDPYDQLELTTENSPLIPFTVLPTFLLQKMLSPITGYGDFEQERIVHAEQGLWTARRVPATGAVSVRHRLDAVFDHGGSAVLVVSCEARDPADGATVACGTQVVHVQGEGGFGGVRRDSPKPRQWADSAPVTVPMPTGKNQALLFRLNGDRNPLHSHPGTAKAMGFDRPILHGLCTLGFAARGIIAAGGSGDGNSGGEIAALAQLRGRFTSPVVPGDELTLQIWADPTSPDGRFRVLVGDRVTVDDGTFKFTHFPVTGSTQE